PISTEAEQVPTDQPFSTAREKVTTATQEITTAEEEAARIRSVKGKAIVIASDQEQTRKISKKDQAQIDFDARLAEHEQAAEYVRKRKLEEDEVASFMEAKRLDKLEAVMAQPLSVVPPTVIHEIPPMFTYVPTEEEIDYLINNDQIIRKKAIELIANTTLDEEQRSAQLKDFIQMKNQQALDEIIGDVRKGQKNPRKPTKVQIIAEMKTFCCHVGNMKMAQFKGMSHDQIEGIYYRIKRQDSKFIPMDQEPLSMKTKRTGVSLESKEAKKLKTQKSSQEEEGPSKLTEEQVTNMLFIETDVLNIEPLQAKYPVVGWEIFSDNFGAAWKIIRNSSVTNICRDFEDIVRCCDREDLD
ncbi:MAG: hypothetical protein J6586_12340, partial [Snodgrassella sp.]|nr:hypothetical protein [Snodgrassella sp.]